MGKKRKNHSSSSSSKRQSVEDDVESDGNPFSEVVESDSVPAEEDPIFDEDNIAVDVPPDDGPDDLLSEGPVPPEEEEPPAIVPAPVAKKAIAIEIPADPAEDIDIEVARKALTCPICCNTFRYPVVNCIACKNYPMCHECLQNFAQQKNGNTQITPCPGCRGTKGFEESRIHNGWIGQKRIPCKNQPKGCREQPQQDQHENHLNKYCLFSPVTCRNVKFGCPWRDFRGKLAAHEDLCECEKKALRIKKREEGFKMLNDKVRESQRLVEIAIDDLELATQRAADLLRTETEQLYLQQKTLSMFKPISSFNKLRKPDTIAVNLHNSSSKPITMNVEISLDGKSFFSLTAFTNAPHLRYPLVVAGYVLPQDASIGAGSVGVVPFALKFNKSNQKYRIFKELDVFPFSTEEEQEQIIEARDPLIKFAIIGSVLWPNEKRA